MIFNFKQRSDRASLRCLNSMAKEQAQYGSFGGYRGGRVIVADAGF